MEIIKKILHVVLLTLFIEALLFAPVVFMVASFGDFARTLKYLVPFLIALLPYIIMKKMKAAARSHNISILVLMLIISVCFLVYFSCLSLISCAGHPPY